MVLRSFIRMSAIVSVAMLCTAFAVYSYLRLHAADRAKDFNLYTLVPQDVIAVVETDRMADLIDEINAMQCSKDRHFLYVSELFAYLKNYLTSWVDDAPHGLSMQMNKMLISFHKPDTPMNQVLYCALGTEDADMIEAFIKKYASSSFPPKVFDYEGESIYIYPLSDGRFLAVYFTSDFLVVSFQKRLVEQVIDAYHSKTSLMSRPVFEELYSSNHAHSSATVYLRMGSVDMGKGADSTRVSASLGSWAEFDLKFGESAIYCTGVSHGADTTLTFMNALRKQQPIEGFSGHQLPASTFFYNCWALSDKSSIFAFTSRQEYTKAAYSDYVKERDREWEDFLEVHGGNQVVSCLFLPKDSADLNPCAVMSIPMKNVQVAEASLRALLYATSYEADVPRVSSAACAYRQYPLARGYQQFVLPRNTLLTQLTGITQSAFYTYGCFYKGNLLLAPDARSISAYIHALESGEILEGVPGYEEGAGSLSPVYNYVMMTDMAILSTQPESYVRLIPNFFFRHADFFKHFLLSIQFTCTDGVVYPNIVLLYK